MNSYEAALRGLKADLSRLGIQWALVGGFAVIARGGGRFTNDIDLVATVVDDQQAEQLTFRLRQLGYEVHSELEQEAVGRLSTVRFESPHGGPPAVVVDVIFATTGIEPEIVQAAQDGEVVRGLRVPIASRAHLLAMKVLSSSPDRPHDEWDIATLLRHATATDIEEAREALSLMELRGFNRGRDLQVILQEFVAKEWGG